MFVPLPSRPRPSRLLQSCPVAAQPPSRPLGASFSSRAFVPPIYPSPFCSPFQPSSPPPQRCTNSLFIRPSTTNKAARSSPLNPRSYPFLYAAVVPPLLVHLLSRTQTLDLRWTTDASSNTSP